MITGCVKELDVLASKVVVFASWAVCGIMIIFLNHRYDFSEILFGYGEVYREALFSRFPDYGDWLQKKEELHPLIFDKEGKLRRFLRWIYYVIGVIIIIIGGLVVFGADREVSMEEAILPILFLALWIAVFGFFRYMARSSKRREEKWIEDMIQDMDEARKDDDDNM